MMVPNYEEIDSLDYKERTHDGNHAFFYGDVLQSKTNRSMYNLSNYPSSFHIATSTIVK
jgi:hypothetical protein